MANVEALVADLQANMQLYDELQAELSAMRFDLMAADAVLEGIDLEEMYQATPLFDRQQGYQPIFEVKYLDI